jgi:hypothetical protein
MTGVSFRAAWAALLLVPAGVFALAVGCDDDPPPADADGDGDVDGDSDGDGDGDPTLGFDKTVVSAEGMGNFVTLDISSSGTVGVAYYTFDARDDGLCTEVLGDPPTKRRAPIYYMERPAGATAWSEPELVAEPIHLGSFGGLSLRYAPSGIPSIAFWGGDPIDVLCSANDAILATRTAPGTWATEAAATASSAPMPAWSEESTCPAAASQAGYAVGEMPALDFDSAGTPAILYRDTHYGGMQEDDIRRADAEIAIREGGWATQVVDCDGAGQDNALVFDTDDRPVTVQRVVRDSHVDDRHGLWASRRETDGTWLAPVRLAQGSHDLDESSIVAGPNGHVAVVYYDPTPMLPWVAELIDPTRFGDGASWYQEELGSINYNEGLNPSIAIAPDGDLAVAYRRCNRSGSGDECSHAVDAVVFARRLCPPSAIDPSGCTWRYETVDEGNPGANCAEQGTALGIAPDGTVWIAYDCSRAVTDTTFVTELVVATSRRPM